MADTPKPSTPSGPKPELPNTFTQPRPTRKESAPFPARPAPGK